MFNWSKGRKKKAQQQGNKAIIVDDGKNGDDDDDLQLLKENAVPNPMYKEKIVKNKSSRSLTSLTDVGRTLSKKFGNSLKGGLFSRSNSAVGDKGATVVISGVNGAGKTTLFKVLVNISESEVAQEESNTILEGMLMYRGVEFKLVDLSGDSGGLDWLEHFSHASAIVFVVSLGSYDETDESTGQNKLVQSLSLFKSALHNNLMSEPTMVLIFNKSQELREKLTEKKISLNTSGEFSDAPTDFDYDNAVKWFRRRYSQIAGRKKWRSMLVQQIDVNEPSKYSKELQACANKIIKTKKKGNRYDNLL